MFEIEKAGADLELVRAQVAREEAQRIAHLASARYNEAYSEAQEVKNKHALAGSLETGKFLFAEVVTPDTVEGWMTILSQFSRRHPGAPILLRINSGGGSVVAGFALFDLIQELRRDGHKVTTRSFGMAASMGGVLLQAGDVRQATRHSHMLVHEGSLSFQGSVGAVEDTIKFSTTLRSQCLDILAARSTLSRDEIADKWARRDWWLDASAMLECGFVDEVIG